MRSNAPGDVTGDEPPGDSRPPAVLDYEVPAERGSGLLVLDVVCGAAGIGVLVLCLAAVTAAAGWVLSANDPGTGSIIFVVIVAPMLVVALFACRAIRLACGFLWHYHWNRRPAPPGSTTSPDE